MDDKLPKNDIEKYKAIFENVSDIVTYVDISGKILDVNSRVKDLLGYEKDEIIGKFFFQTNFIDAQEIKNLLGLFRDSIVSGKIKSKVEVNLHSKADGIKTFEVNTSFVRDGLRIKGIVNIFRDVTSYKRSFDLLKRSTEELKERVKELNALYKVNRALGNSDLDYDSMFKDIVNSLKTGTRFPDITEIKIEIYKDVFTTENFSNSEANIVTEIIIDQKPVGKITIEYSDTQDITKVENMTYFLDEEVNLLNGVAEEIEQYLERLDIETKYRSNQEWLKSVLENMTDSVIIIDSDKKIILWNRGSERLFGYSKKEATNLDINKLFKDNSFIDRLSSAVENDSIFTSSIEVEGNSLNNESLSLEISSDKWSNAGKEFITMITRDISERIRVKKEIETKDNILEVINKIAEDILKTKKWDNVITDLLTKILEVMKVSRVYIFENFDEEGKSYTRQLFEVVSEKDQVKMHDERFWKLPFEDIEKYVEILMNNNEIHTLIKDLPEPQRELFSSQNVKSILLVPIFVENKWWGIIGFDECSYEREWKQVEIDALKTAGNMVSAAIVNSNITLQISEVNALLAKKNQELEKFNKLMIGRELRMVELKNKLKNTESVKE